MGRHTKGNGLKHILITGATGFIARSLIPVLLSKGCKVSATVRDKKEVGYLTSGVKGIIAGDLDLITDWKFILDGVDAVVHLAAIVHKIKKDEQSPEDAYQRVNVGITKTLADASNEAGVKRLVFASSVKAMGESTSPGKAWDELSPCSPEDAYGRSKYEAEIALNEIGRKKGLEVVILRLPLVYGPGVKANMAKLFKMVNTGLPLPLRMVNNLRSLLYVGNLVDAIKVSLEHPAAAGETFLVSDGEDVSTPELIRRIANALGRRARLFPFPPSVIRLVGRMVGKSEEVDRLLGSLVVDSSKIQWMLKWKPPYAMEQGLKETAIWYKSNERGL